MVHQELQKGGVPQGGEVCVAAVVADALTEAFEGESIVGFVEKLVQDRGLEGKGKENLNIKIAMIVIFDMFLKLFFMMFKCFFFGGEGEIGELKIM